MDNLNFDKNTMNKLNDMINSGDISNIISQIPPEMLQNFSSMMQNNTNSSPDYNNAKNTTNENSSNVSNPFNNIDMNTILKMKSVMEKLNQKDDPRSNLLYSLKPYLREEKKEKLDQYTNLLNVAKIAELFKNDNKETHKND